MADRPAALQDELRNRYVVQRELGRGGRAIVYLVRDLEHDHALALKAMHPEIRATSARSASSRRSASPPGSSIATS